MRTKLLLASLFALLSSLALAGEPREKLKPEVLDQKIEEVIHEPRFAWRMPRQVEVDEQAAEFFLVRALRQFFKSFGRLFDAIARWIEEFFRNKDLDPESAARTARQAIQASLYGLLFLIAAAAAWLFWKSRKTQLTTATELPVTPAIDLTSPDISPALLAEDEWLALAREYLEKNEPLLALRAYYLAGLALLARKELVRADASKSNREYQAELGRRARAVPDLVPIFAQNVTLFERCWYGGHAVERASINEFLVNLERMRTLAP